MRKSLLSFINCIGSISMMQFFYIHHPDWRWSTNIAIIVLAVMAVAVQNRKEILAVGAAGTVIFLFCIKDTIFSNRLSKNSELAINILIILILAIIAEYISNEKITLFNVIFDIILAVFVAFLIERFPGTSWVLPFGLIIFFWLVICINFDAQVRKD